MKQEADKPSDERAIHPNELQVRTHLILDPGN